MYNFKVSTRTMHDEKEKIVAHVSYREFIDVNLAISHTAEDSYGRYTVYDIILKTNSISFSFPISQVQRRYSDFVWLRRRLKKICSITANAPNLPKKQLSIWNFDEYFLEKRRSDLELFLRRVVRETVFLSSSALHLFLQTELNTTDMEACIISGRVNEAIERHSGRVPIPDSTNKLINSCESAPGSLSSLSELESGDGASGENEHTQVFWKVEENTMRRISSFTTVRVTA